MFVFTITQLTSLLAREPTLIGLLQTMVIFGNVWWMYGGYAWLTNAVPPRELGVRLLLLVGMSGFLLIALAIPTAFGAGGIAFGVGYMIVTLVHTGVFMRTSQQTAIQALRVLGPPAQARRSGRGSAEVTTRAGAASRRGPGGGRAPDG